MAVYRRTSRPRYTLLLLILTSITLVLFARAYYVQLRAMDENARLMEKYLKE